MINIGMKSYHPSEHSICIYGGIKPRDVNHTWDDHCYSSIVCLINGERKKKIESGYLQKLGFTKEMYYEQFPGSPLICEETRQKYARVTEARKMSRSTNMKNLNSSTSFEAARQDGLRAFWLSSVSGDMRKLLSDKAKQQHADGLAKHIRDVYWETVYPGSKEQTRRREAMKSQFDALFVPTPYKNSHLYTMSTYEVHFLNHIENLGISLNRVKNGPHLSNDTLFYPCDFILDNSIVIEIKSTYILELQESRRPGVTNLKKELVKESGFEFILVLDKNYQELEQIL